MTRNVISPVPTYQVNFSDGGAVNVPAVHASGQFAEIH